MKESGKIEIYKSIGLTSNMSEKAAISFCKKLATEIEVSTWITFKEKLSNEYKAKFRSLVFNLQDTRNAELRLAILSGSIKTCDIPKLNSMQLAPSQLKQMREQRETKYFKEHVCLEEDIETIKVLMKSQTVKNHY